MQVFSRVLVALTWCAAASAGHAQETLFVQVPAVLDDGAPIAQAVQRECNVESTMGHQIFSAVQKTYSGPIQMAADPGGRALRLTILGVTGVGPGPWSGAKTISLRADLMQGDTVATSQVFNKAVGGGGRIRGACQLFEIIATRLARDVSLWLPVAIANQPEGVARSAALPPAPTQRSATERMQVLKELLDGGLITKDEYEKKRVEVLKDL